MMMQWGYTWAEHLKVFLILSLRSPSSPLNVLEVPELALFSGKLLRKERPRKRWRRIHVEPQSIELHAGRSITHLSQHQRSSGTREDPPDRCRFSCFLAALSPRCLLPVTACPGRGRNEPPSLFVYVCPRQVAVVGLSSCGS